MVNIADVLNDLKQTLAHLYHEMDSEWTGDGDVYDIKEIKGVADKYGWNKEDVLKSIPPIY